MRLASVVVFIFTLFQWPWSGSAAQEPSDECVIRMNKSPEVKRFFTNLLISLERLHHEPSNRRESSNWSLSIYRSWLEEQNLSFAHITTLDACLGGLVSTACSAPWREFSLNYALFLNDLQDFQVCERPSDPKLEFVTPTLEELIRRGQLLHREVSRQFLKASLLRSVAAAEREATRAIIELQNLGQAPHLCVRAQTEIESQAVATFTEMALRRGVADLTLGQVLSQLRLALEDLGCPQAAP